MRLFGFMCVAKLPSGDRFDAASPEIVLTCEAPNREGMMSFFALDNGLSIHKSSMTSNVASATMVQKNELLPPV